MKIELKTAIILWQLEQKPKYGKFLEWLRSKNFEIPTEGEKWDKRWLVATCEEGIQNPEGLRGGRIELHDLNSTDYPLEYNLTLPSDLWEILDRIIDSNY